MVVLFAPLGAVCHARCGMPSFSGPADVSHDTAAGQLLRDGAKDAENERSERWAVFSLCSGPNARVFWLRGDLGGNHRVWFLPFAAAVG